MERDGPNDKMLGWFLQELSWARTVTSNLEKPIRAVGLGSGPIVSDDFKRRFDESTESVRCQLVRPTGLRPPPL